MALARSGHKVTVLAGRPSYNPQEIHRHYLWRTQHDGLVTIERVGSAAHSRHRMRGRILNYLSYITLATLRALQHRTDVVMAMTDPPIAGFAAAITARLKRLPFVYSIQDLHPDMALAAGMIAPGAITAFWEQLHCWVLRQADVILTLGTDMHSRIVAKGIHANRVQVIRLGSDLLPPLSETDNPVIRKIRRGFAFTLVHAGNLGFYGAWNTLIQAARRLECRGVGLVFIGSGAAEEHVRALASGSHNVRFLPFQPPEKLPHVMASGDLQIITVQKGMEGLVVPSKLYTILAAGRPLLVVADATCDAAQLIQAHHCGMVAPPDDAAAVCMAVTGIMDDPDQRSQMAVNAAKLARQLDRRKQLQKVVTAVKKAAIEFET
jgi:colanic acid biosynthesis glycosyl transferase WcaI